MVGIFVLMSSSVSLSIAQWKSYTMKRDVRDLVLGSDSTVWAATSGGLFSFHFADSTYGEYTTSEGLRSVDLSAAAVDSQGRIWIGATNGFIQRYSPITHEWISFTYISDRRDPQKRINALQVHGDTLAVLSDIGISFLSISRLEFGDTYMQFGLGPAALADGAVDFETHVGRMWIATPTGVASTPLTNPNPATPESWQVYRLNSLITGLALLDTSLFVSTSVGLERFDGLSWSIVAGTSGLNILGISDELPRQSGCGRVFEFFTRSELWSFAIGDAVTRLSATFPSILTAISREGILGSQSSGAIVYNSCANDRSPTIGILSVLIPPGPPSNKFIGIAVDGRGVVWSGTGAVDGEGFMSFDGSHWKLYSVASEPQLGTNNFYKVSIGANNAKWISNWYSGIALVDDEGHFKKMYNASNGLPPSLDPSYVIAGGVAADRNGRTWIADRTPPGDTSVVIFNPDSTFSYVVGCGLGCATRQRQVGIITYVVIDEYGTKWFMNFSRFEPYEPDRLFGFLFYNERVALPGTSRGWGRLTTADGLSSSQVWSAAVDREGTIWIGSDRGVSIIFNPADPHEGIVAYHPPPVNDQVIQGIVVDALNNKWIATKQGVFVLPPDGTSIIDQYTEVNTGGKLLDDDVNSIAIDSRTGVIYFGTEKGLTSLATSAIEPKRSFDDLSFSPNPFRVPSPTLLTVDGLVAGSTLKILSIDGNLVREVQTPGGRVGFWDGRDDRGRIVATGIYIIVAYSEDGSRVAKGKLAVIRQ